MVSAKFKNRISERYWTVLEEYISCCPVKVVDMSNALGINVYKALLPKGQSGLIRNNIGVYEIVVNASDFQERMRFTIAHELAHFLLHQNQLEPEHIDHIPILQRTWNVNSGLQKIEREADELAAEILMPEASYRTEIDKIVSNLCKRNQVFEVDDIVVQVADIFGVSRTAASIRYTELYGI